MCRVEYTSFTCGHTADHSVDCEFAEAFGPLFNRSGCVNYSFDSTHPQIQCGKLHGFYCAKTQNGTIIDKCREVLQRMSADYRDKNDEKNRVTSAWESYRKETVARKQPLESLAANPTYRNIDHQRQQLIIECNALENRRQYLNGLISHAYKNRHLLAPDASYQPLWDPTSFDFDASIFPPRMLEPIRRQFPNGYPTSIAPAARGTAHVTSQQQHPQEGMGLAPVANLGMTAQPVQQTRKPEQQPMGPVTPKRQTKVKSKPSPIGEGIVRGQTPEGETREEKAIRYRDQLKALSALKTANAMAAQGYDVQKHGVSAGPKVGGRRPARPKPATPANDGSPMGPPRKPSPKVNKSPTPKVRRSARTRNTKPKYTDSPGGDPDLELSPRVNATEKSDEAWNASADRSDDSWSPEMQAQGGKGGHNRRVTPTSSAGNPTRGKASLSNKILDYQRSTVSSGMPGQDQGATSSMENPFQSGPQSTSPQLPQTNGGLPYQQPFTFNPLGTYGQPGHTSHVGGSASGPTMTRDAFNRASPSQRSTYLAQQLGRTLYKQQLASGIVSASPSPQTPQENSSPRMPYAAQTRAPSVSPLQSSPSHFGSLPYDGLPMPPPANLFQQNYQQSMAQAPMGRSFSTGSVPTSNMFSPSGRDGPMPTLNSNFQPHAPALYDEYENMRRNSISTANLPPLSTITGEQTHAPAHWDDYESMRRSFGSATNLPPLSTITGDYSLPDCSPAKRSVPPSSPTAVRKRVRLSIPGQSLPGEDEAPVLRPSASSFQLHAPAGLPADDTVNFAASIEAIEQFERENAAAQPATTSDPQHPHDGATPAHTNTHETTNDTANANSHLPESQHSTQSYEPIHNLGDAIMIPSNMADKSSEPSEPSDFNQQGQNDAFNLHDANSLYNTNNPHDTNNTHDANNLYDTNNLYDDAKDAVSEPDWDLLADGVFQMP